MKTEVKKAITMKNYLDVQKPEKSTIIILMIVYLMFVSFTGLKEIYPLLYYSFMLVGIEQGVLMLAAGKIQPAFISVPMFHYTCTCTVALGARVASVPPTQQKDIFLLLLYILIDYYLWKASFVLLFSFRRATNGDILLCKALLLRILSFELIIFMIILAGHSLDQMLLLGFFAKVSFYLSVLLVPKSIVIEPKRVRRFTIIFLLINICCVAGIKILTLNRLITPISTGIMLISTSTFALFVIVAGTFIRFIISTIRTKKSLFTVIFDLEKTSDNSSVELTWADNIGNHEYYEGDFPDLPEK